MSEYAQIDIINTAAKVGLVAIASGPAAYYLADAVSPWAFLAGAIYGVVVFSIISWGVRSTSRNVIAVAAMLAVMGGAWLVKGDFAFGVLTMGLPVWMADMAFFRGDRRTAT
jgi:hypothetical protein